MQPCQQRPVSPHRTHLTKIGGPQHLVMLMPCHALWAVAFLCGNASLVASRYIDFVLRIVAREDPSRVIWPASPSCGWASGVHRMSGRPNGNKLQLKRSSHCFESHGPYIRGASRAFSYINNGGSFELNGLTLLADPEIPGEYDVATVNVGPAYPSRFVSEFGTIALSSFESMSATISPEHW